MQKPDAERLSWLWEQVQRYQAALAGSEAEEYLLARGLTPERIRTSGLGLVSAPSTEHEHFEGFLSIPYLRRTPRGEWMCPSIRFRCLEDHEHIGHGKYMTTAGDRPRLYNTVALSRESDVIAICEGELDTLAATEAGVPAVGIPGAEAWQSHWALPFAGYRRVVLLPDGDDAGERWARKLAKQIKNSVVIPSPAGTDVNDYLVSYGPDALRERITP